MIVQPHIQRSILKLSWTWKEFFSPYIQDVFSVNTLLEICLFQHSNIGPSFKSIDIFFNISFLKINICHKMMYLYGPGEFDLD